MDTEHIQMPDSISQRVAFDRKTNCLYTDRRFASDPHLLSWVERNKAKNIRVTVHKVEIDQLATLRAGVRTDIDIDVDMVVRREAVELLRKAAAYGASDVHIMLRGTHAEVQIVIKGGLRVLTRLTQAEGESYIRAIYQGVAKTRDSSFNELECQNAQIAGDVLPPGSNVTSIRIVRGPAYPQDSGGGFMTLRMQYGMQQPSEGTTQHALAPLELPRVPSGTFRLPAMGYREKQLAKLRMIMDAPNGVIIFTGPTGTGKTATMYEVLQESARTKPHRRLVTIEDPVENPMPWAVQLLVNNARTEAETGEAYQERMRVALRMAPNNILLGELRGPDVAVTALTAAVTGHLIVTTMHVTDPFLFVERLELMDKTRLDRRVFCDHKIIRGVVAQRLLPKLCPHCSTLLNATPNALPERIIKAMKTWGDISRVRLKGAGCSACGNDGTTKRFAIAEVVVMDESIMHDFIAYGSAVARKNYRARPDADQSMFITALAHAFAGEVDPRAVEECVDLVEEKPH